MPTGPGIYDDLATIVRKRTNADAVILMVVGGEKGNGFSVQTDLRLLLNLPDILRQMADQLEAEQTKQ